jgi:hypothetical protein
MTPYIAQRDLGDENDGKPMPQQPRRVSPFGRPGCPDCDGTGGYEFHGWEFPCKTCEGTGRAK